MFFVQNRPDGVPKHLSLVEKFFFRESTCQAFPLLVRAPEKRNRLPQGLCLNLPMNNPSHGKSQIFLSEPFRNFYFVEKVKRDKQKRASKAGTYAGKLLHLSHSGGPADSHSHFQAS